MKFRSLLIALLITSCIFVPALPSYAAAAPDHNRVVNFTYQAIAPTFIFGKSIGVPEIISMSQVYDTLLFKDNNGVFNPNLADKWSISDDGLEYVFNLRKDVKWQDGVQFTAKDVEFTFSRLAKEPAYSWIYDANIERMETPDDYTIKIFMKKPNALFISQLAAGNGLIMPKHGFDKYGEDYGSAVDKIIGTGAYIVTDWQPNVSITYKAKEDYFMGAPDIKNMVLHRITDTNAAIVAMQTGELDLCLTPINGSAYKTLSGNSNIVMGEFMSARNEAIYMYCKQGMFADVKMRRAVAHAISKEDVLTVGNDGLGKVINYPGDIGDAMTANPNIVPAIQYEYNLDRARELVKEAGFEGASVVVKSYNTDPYAVIGTYLQGVLNDIGLKATVEPMERATFLAQLDNEDLSIFPMGWVGSAYDIEEVLGATLHSNNLGTAGNDSFYINPEMDKLIEQARGTADIQKRKDYYTQVINKFMEDVPYISTFVFQSAIPRNVDLTTTNPKSYRIFDYHWAR
ncbi:MAG: ABC transporter substrate-binding protein [Synergistaceae bacterium]|nr:ABC transporter substrate-binding protein [Synergistaceae bacterium]